MLIGSKHSEETKHKISLAHQGKLLSKEHRHKLSEAHKGKPTWNKGKKTSEETKHKISECKKRTAKRGEEHHNWKGGRNYKCGYIFVLKPNHPYCNLHGYVREHRLIMEEHLGRYLEPDEVVHHLDGNNSNNKIENLYLFKDNQEHLKYHRFLKDCVREIMEV